MIARVGTLRENLRGTPDKKRGVLVKALKPTQDAKTDMPVIGVETVRSAAEAGLAGIALEAGESLIVGKAAVAAEADRLGLFVRRRRRRDAENPDAGLRRAVRRPAGRAVDGGHQARWPATASRSPAWAARRWRAKASKACFRSTTTAVMGLREVVPAIPAILRRVQQAADFALQTRPDAVVLIDSPDFTHRIARAMKKRDPSIKTVNYVAPQVWASRAYRAKAMARYFDLVLALFPFEVPFFEKYGLQGRLCRPSGDRAARPHDRRRRLCARGWASRADAPLLAMLPGSRTSEIRLIFPTFRAAVELLAKKIPGLVTRPAHRAACGGAACAEAPPDWPTPLHILESEADKFAAFDAADVALAASGTVTAELALSRTPMVVAYRVGGLTYALAQPA